MLSESALKNMMQGLAGVFTQAPGAWLRVAGPDAEEFLQGQCTQDVRRLGVGRTSWALWLTIKGRVVGESLILREAGTEGGVWWLWSAHTAGEALQARLQEFIIADDVTVEDAGAGGGWEQVTLAGEAARAWLRAELGGAEPPGEGAWVPLRGGYVFAGRRGQTRVWEWLRPRVDGTADLTPPGLAELRAEDVVRSRIAAGVPAIPGEFGAADLPQEAGLEAVSVSFEKGCYLGQEVMARLHAMGRVRRRLLRVAGEGPAPSAGAGLHQPQDGKRAGELRVAVDDGVGGWIGLAMVNLLGLDPMRALKLGAETAVGAGWSVVLIDRPQDEKAGAA